MKGRFFGGEKGEKKWRQKEESGKRKLLSLSTKTKVCVFARERFWKTCVI